jgi:GDP-L-fucose synthase
MRVLILGATGFIGRNLVNFFRARKECEIYATFHRRPPFSADNVKWIKSDLTQAEFVKDLFTKVDVVLQAAATTSGARDIVNTPYIHVTDNAVMNSLIFRAAYEAKVKHLVFFSCSVMYKHSETVVKEIDLDLNAEFEKKYFAAAWTKLYLEKQAEFFSTIGDTKFTILRHSNIYGPFDKFDLERSHVFGATITKVLSNESGILEVWGDGSERRDFLYVDDLVEAVDFCIDRQRNKYRIYNIGSGKAVSVNELVSAVIRKSGKKLKIKHLLNAPSIPVNISLDCSRANSELGWSCSTSLDNGIELTIKWWNDNIAR